MEIILSLLWLIGVLVGLIFAGLLLRCGRGESSFGGPYCLKYRPLPNPLVIQGRKRHPISNRLSRFN